MTSEKHLAAAQHTPGPWSIGDAFGCAKGHAVCAGPFVIARIVESRGEHINGEKRTPFDYGSANARVIATAPELLEWAKRFRQTLEFYIRKDEREGDHEGARLKTITLMTLDETLAKAEGRS